MALAMGSYKIADGERISERGGNWFTRSSGAGANPIPIVWSSSSRSTVRMTQRGSQQVPSCLEVGQALSTLAKGDGYGTRWFVPL